MDYTIKENEVVQKENTLIVISDDVTDETVLAVLAALQAYESSAYTKVKGTNATHKQNVKLDLHITIVCKNPEYDFIWLRCLTKIRSIFRSTNDYPDEIFTYVAIVSIEAARGLGNKTRHIADLLGILLGAEASSLPDVSNLVTKFSVTNDLLIHRFNLPDNDNVMPVDSILFSHNTIAPLSLEGRTKHVFGSKAVFGTSSYETYLACALKKPVVEIQKDTQLYKWSNPNYICITDESDQEALQKAIDKCCSLLAK
jgi:hypothetical protein